MSITIKADGSVTVDSIQEAAAIMRLMKDKPVTEVQPAPSRVPLAKHKVGTPARDLLRAGGFQAVREPTLKLYSFMLDNHHKVWTAKALASRLHRESKPINNMLSKLARRGIIARVGFAQYKVK